ncbi:hypothetical protein BJX61DRAFT_521632 [Aspergillus egyptiacus]|nr:hypothetical protein BJX61DRAFT_521632 [Aspergillus egyptiacus]
MPVLTSIVTLVALYITLLTSHRIVWRKSKWFGIQISQDKEDCPSSRLEQLFTRPDICFF